nr:hypothetical protein CFP56_39876 [Quercus suber]
MDADFIEWLQSITLIEEEGEAIQVGAHHKEQILEESSLSLLGRFLTNRSYNQRAAKSLLRSMWKMGTNLWIVDMGKGLFQFKFAMESQIQWALANAQWSFEDHPLVLRRFGHEAQDYPYHVGTTLAAKPYGEWLKVGFRKLDFGPTNRRRRSPPCARMPTAHREQLVADDTLRPRGNGGPFGFNALREISNVNLILQEYQGGKATTSEVGLEFWRHQAWGLPLPMLNEVLIKDTSDSLVSVLVEYGNRDQIR